MLCSLPNKKLKLKIINLHHMFSHVTSSSRQCLAKSDQLHLPVHVCTQQPYAWTWCWGVFCVLLLDGNFHNFIFLCMELDNAIYCVNEFVPWQMTPLAQPARAHSRPPSSSPDAGEGQQVFGRVLWFVSGLGWMLWNSHPRRSVKVH